MNVIHCSKRRVCFVTPCAVVVGLVASASAQTVLIDFGSNTSYRGLSVPNPDTNGNYWNSVQPGIFVENLVASQQRRDDDRHWLGHSGRH